MVKWFQQSNSMEEEIVFATNVLGQMDTQTHTHTDTHTHRHKMNFKINLNGFYTYTRAKIIKLLEFLHDLGLGKTLKIWHQKVQSIKEFIKLNNQN